MTESLLEGEYVPSSVDFVREQVEQYERTDGKEGGTMRDAPVVIVTMRGARSGKLRKVPLMRIERDGTYALGANGFVPDQNPQWYHNLLANPTVQLQDGATRSLMIARLAYPDERADWLAYIDQLYSFAAHERDAASESGRQIPVILLEPQRSL